MSETYPEVDTQQPTPPTEQEGISIKMPSSAKRHQPPPPGADAQALTQELVKKTPQIVTNLVGVERRMMDDYEPEKPLSDCDDDEFVARLPGVLAQARSSDYTNSGTRPKNSLAYWVIDGRQAVFLREKASPVRDH